MKKHLLSLILAAAPLASAQAQSAAPAPRIDFNQLPGTWFEQAHLPNKSEKKCVTSPTVLYALSDKPNRLQIVQTCKQKDGSTNVSNSTARTADKGKNLKVTDGKLKIPSFLPYFLAKKYWILAIAPDASWLLVGTPNHKTLQILSKTTTAPPDLLTTLKSQAATQGYPVAKLISLPQVP